MARIGLRAPSAVGEQEENRRKADARGVPAEIMMPRLAIIVASFLLALLGIVMVFSASMVTAIDFESSVYSNAVKQLAFALVGAILAYAAYRVPYHVWLTKAFYVPWGICMVLLVLILFLGQENYGATRWIPIPGLGTIQPSEFAKVALVMAAAKLMHELSEGQVSQKRFAGMLFATVIFPLLFLYKTQSDLGSAMVIAVGILAVLWMADVPVRAFLGIIVLGILGVIVSLTVGYRSERMATWLNPWEYASGDGYQVVRSFYAFSEGGIFGVGLGNSKEKFLHLPFPESDFIFSIIGEELGMIGCVAVIALFMVILVSGLRIAALAPDKFGTTLAAGLTVMLVGQAFLNMGCATGLLPTTGKPLPFLSSGGSSMISSLITVGLILSVSRGSNVLSTHERRRNDLNVLRVEHSGESGRVAARTSRRSADRIESLRFREGSRIEGPARRRTERPASRDGLASAARAKRRSDLNLVSGRARSHYNETDTGRTARRSERPRRGRR